MRVLVASDKESFAADIRELLLGGCPGCSEVEVARLDEAVDRAIQLHPGAVVLGLPPAPERALEVLREIQEVLPSRILAIGPGDDARLILRALHEGAWRYVDEAELDADLPAAFRRLSVETPPKMDLGRLITVVGTSGGSGASTLAANVAACLSAEHRSCALLDLKLEAGDLATLLDLQPPHSLADFCENANRMDPSMFERCFARHASGVCLMSPPSDYAQLSRITVNGVRKALAMARRSFPYVVVDLDNTYRREHAQALFQSDVIMLVLRLDFTSLRQARRVLDYLDALRIDRRKVQLAVNRYKQPRQLRIADVEQTLGMEVGYSIPDDPRTVNRANNKGVPVVLEKPHARVSQILSHIAHSVNGKSNSNSVGV